MADSLNLLTENLPQFQTFNFKLKIEDNPKFLQMKDDHRHFQMQEELHFS